MRIPLPVIAVLIVAVAACAPAASKNAEPAGVSAISGAPSATGATSGAPLPTNAVPTGAASSASSAPIAGPAYPDGIPETIDGERVLRPNDAETIPADDTPFLVGGWTRSQPILCPPHSYAPGATEQLAILDIFAPQCPAGPTLGETLDDMGMWGILRNPTRLALPDPGAVVVRLHYHDPRAAQCPANLIPDCDSAAILDAVVWRRDGAPPTPTLGPVSATMSVGAFVSARDAGTLPDGPILLHGYWTYRAVGHSCAAPNGPTGELELYCNDGEWGITDRNEPILTYVRTGLNGNLAIPASGPAITPYVPNPLMGRLLYFGPNAPYGGIADGLWALPVPIVVLGHVHDPRAADCRPSARQICEERFVVDRIVEYDPASVPPPSPSPPPTPFPSPPPAPLFTKAQCHGDIPYSFIGWAPLNTLDIGDQRSDHVYAMVTRDTILLGDWVADPARKGHRFRVWGRSVCFSGDAGAVEFSEVAGTAYRLYDDGSRVPGI